MQLPKVGIALVAIALLSSAVAEAQPSKTKTKTATIATPETPVEAPNLVPPRSERRAKAEREISLDELLEGKDRTGSPSLPPAEPTIPTSSAEPGEDRPLPNYDGREDEGANAGEVLLWIPRVVFFPVHLVFEYLIRWPIVGALTFLEEHYVIKRVERILTWRDGKSGVYPSFFADFGLRPAVGLTTFHRDLFVDGNTFEAGFGTWGPRWLNITASNETTVLEDQSGRVRFSGMFGTRPDQPFYGLGPATSTDNERRFQWSRYQVAAEFLASLGGLNRLQVGTAFRHVDFLDNPENPGLTPAEATNPGDRLYAPGFADDSYEIVETQLALKIDTRNPDTEFYGGTGYLLELYGTFAFDFTDTSRNYLRWGGETAGFIDFTGRGHVLALRLSTEIVEETGGSVVPFTELAALGGLESMRGYLQRRFVGDSSIFGTLSYRYPVWSLIDAEVFASAGNVFNERLAGFAFDKLYLSTGIGLRTSIARDTGVTFMFALGSNRFDSDDFEIDSVRVVFGLVQGF